MKLLQSGDLSRGDLILPGRHYAAASLNVALGRGEDWSAGVFWLSNLSDGSRGGSAVGDVPPVRSVSACVPPPR